MVQGSCLLSLLALAACQDEVANQSAAPAVTNLAATAPTAKARRASRPVQWGLLPMTALPQIEITAATEVAGVRVMRHTKQDSWRPHKTAARLAPSRTTTIAKNKTRLLRIAAFSRPAPRGQGGFDTMLARHAGTQPATPRLMPAKPRQQLAARAPQPVAAPVKPGAIEAKPAPAQRLAALPRPGTDGLSTGSINHARSLNVDRPQKGYLALNPQSPRFKLAILGDSLGVGIGLGMSRSFVRQSRLHVLKESKEGSGLARPDFYNWDRHLSRVVRNNDIDIAIVEIGANDGQSIRAGGRIHAFGSHGWRREYAKRVDRFIDKLQREHASIYWVEVPPMGRPQLNSQVQTINKLIKSRVTRRGIKYIPTWKRFANRYGQYTAYGHNDNGQKVRIRAKDGVHFTMDGYRMLAAHVEQAISRDLQQALNTRRARLAANAR